MAGKEGIISKAEGYVGTGLPVPYDGEYGPVIDLGLAANPSGAAIEPHVLSASIETEQLAKYDQDVHHTDIKDLLIEGIGLSGISDESILFHPNGSYGAGDEVVRALFRYLSATDRRPTMYVSSYSFPNVAQYASRHGVIYAPLPPGDSLFQEESLANALKMGSPQLEKNIVYIDYPNNPSGVANGDLLREVVSHVAAHGGIPFVDLAFGEVLGGEFRDAIQFTIDHGGVCVGSLTKTQGLPALRAGYIILNPSLSRNLYTEGTRLVFGLPAYVKHAYEILFKQNEDGETLAKHHAEKAAAYNIRTNEIFYEELRRLGLGVAPTILETPIQVIFRPDDDLYIRLARAGIKTESLSEYSGTLSEGTIGYGNQAVRILTPKLGKLEETLERIRLAMSLPKQNL